MKNTKSKLSESAQDVELAHKVLTNARRQYKSKRTQFMSAQSALTEAEASFVKAKENAELELNQKN